MSSGSVDGWATITALAGLTLLGVVLLLLVCGAQLDGTAWLMAGAPLAMAGVLFGLAKLT